MRNKVLGLVILIVFCLAACGAADEPGYEVVRRSELWTRTCVVVEVDGDSVVVEDSVGHLWSFQDSAESWDVGDGCSLLLDDNGTDKIYDDTVVRADFFRVDILYDVFAAGGIDYGSL